MKAILNYIYTYYGLATQEDEEREKREEERRERMKHELKKSIEVRFSRRYVLDVARYLYCG